MNNFTVRGLAAALVVAGITAFTSHASVTCRPDINNDAIVNVADMLAVITGWGPCAGACAADIAPPTLNGVVNTDDLLAVITGWGACGATCTPAQGCLRATSLWCENFELGNYTRWTGGYDSASSCETNGFVTNPFHSGGHSLQSRVLCTMPDSHRGYGGLRFQGNLVLPSFTVPSTGGIDAPNGVVITMWRRIDSPYTFDTNRWVSLLTCTPDCSNSWNNVITLNIDDSSMRLKPVHVSSVSYASGAPAFPRGQWNRVTVYLNFYTGQMHVWQNGTKVCNATFSPAGSRMCQWHFGLYASGPNSDVTMYEDDYSILRLDEPMVNFTAEPRFPTVISPCGVPLP